VPVPGGSIRLEDEHGREVATGGVGEVVYSGPNVMLGYAERPEDLALGSTVADLRTGDLGRLHPDGLLEVVGRRSRVAKVFGLRLDLDRVEDLAAARGLEARCVEHEGRLALFVRRHRDVEAAYAVAGECGLPRSGAVVHVLASFPLTSSGKPDRAALARHAATVEAPRAPTTGAPTPEAVRDLLAVLLGRPDATLDESFASLRGDSLSFVEASVALGSLLGDLPRDWSHRSARDLVPDRPPRRTPWAWVDTPLLMRAVAIVLVVGTHANLLTIPGGAHVLLAVCGFHLARLQLGGGSRGERVRGLLQATARVAVPAGLFIGAAGAVTGMYDASTALFLNGLLGSPQWDLRWQFWFLEVIVWSFLGVAALVSVPALDRLERARPFAFALGVLAATAAARFALVGVEADIPDRYALPVVLWCVALGWAAARAGTGLQRLLVSVLAVGLTAGFFDDPVRELLVASGVVLLVWVPRVRVPRVAVRPLALVAASSLWVYLTHWQVYPHLEDHWPLPATLASFAVGLACWAVHERSRRWVSARICQGRAPRAR
jgi:peptidoglycan/LPS O-acetylase OafA/YrhL